MRETECIVSIPAPGIKAPPPCTAAAIEKDHIRVEAYGTVDELISQLGVCYATTRDAGLRESLHHIQQTLFVLGAELASDARGLTRLSQTIGEEEITAPSGLSTAIWPRAAR